MDKASSVASAAGIGNGPQRCWMQHRVPASKRIGCATKSGEHTASDSEERESALQSPESFAESSQGCSHSLRVATALTVLTIRLGEEVPQATMTTYVVDRKITAPKPIVEIMEEAPRTVREHDERAGTEVSFDKAAAAVTQGTDEGTLKKHELKPFGIKRPPHAKHLVYVFTTKKAHECSKGRSGRHLDRQQKPNR